MGFSVPKGVDYRALRRSRRLSNAAQGFRRDCAVVMAIHYECHVSRRSVAYEDPTLYLGINQTAY